ncbi:glycerophosphodiester phosphodiesterase family protein [Bhargavaea ullalensis]|uniref:Glycerophosphoryl diester phosphodiesterase n=1 Tax=Bhargavaea ullalensis TaxID=1265685 RepID=A0ABV2G9S4_9BACL
MKRLIRLMAACGFLIIGTAACSGKEAGPAELPDDRFLAIAHRGASEYRPENSLPAFRLAEEMDADYIELDIQMTKDGQLVVIHDDDLGRLADEPEKVEDLTLDEMEEIPYGEYFNEKHPASADPAYEKVTFSALDDVLSEIGTSINYYIELKTPDESGDMEQAILDELMAHDIIGKDSVKTDKEGLPRVIFQSFSEDGLIRLHEMRPDLPLFRLFTFADGDDAELTPGQAERISRYASGINIPEEAANKDFIEAMHVHGLKVHVYTVNKEKDVQKLIDMGADGVFTNRPDLAVQYAVEAD